MGDINDNYLVEPLVPSPGSRLTYTEVFNNADAQNPPRPTHRDQPTIYLANSNPTNLQLRIPPDVDRTEYPPITLLRRRGATQAYGIFQNRKIHLNHHHPNWGLVYTLCLVYKRVGQTNTYEAPRLEDAEYVAIKALNKESVSDYLSKGGLEDPYKEIARMQELGDNQHVLGCVEALQDEESKDTGKLYIVMPRACDDGSLKDVIPWGDPVPMEPQRVRAIFRKILKILLYLEQKGICHRDLSPDNFLFLTPDNLVVIDLALSVRIPVNKETGIRTLILDQGLFGTLAWMAPELYRRLNFDGVYSDLWQAAVILYNLLTNQILYHRPEPADNLFLYYVLARGLSSQPINDMTIDVLSRFFRPGQEQQMHTELLTRAIAHQALGPVAMEALENLLHVNVLERWTLAEAIESRFVQEEDDDDD